MIAQVTNDTGGSPTKPAIQHSRTKEEKQARRAAKKKRREEQLAAKAAVAEKETVDGTGSVDSNADPVLGDGAPGSDAGDVATADPAPDNGAGDAIVADPVTDDDAGDTDSTSDAVIGLDKAQAAVNMAQAHLEASKPEGMSSRDWKAEKWKRKTALSAANAALAKLTPTADEGNPDRVEPKGADFVSSVNADYDSTGEALAKEAKVATIDGKAFNAAPILDGSENDESIKVGDELVEHGSFAAIEEAEKKDEPVEEVIEPAPAEETKPTEETVEPAPAVEEKPPEEAPAQVVPEQTGPTLVVNNTPHTTAERNELIDGAMKFYGKAFTAERSSLLTEAYRFLLMAVKAEAAGKASNVEMALRAALKNENAAFALDVAKAA